MLNYNDESIKDIFRYASELVGKKFIDILKNIFGDIDLLKAIEYYNNPKAKGSLGTLTEKYYFFYKPNNYSIPDFQKVGLELKVTPYENTKKGLKAGERLVISMIPNDKPIDINFIKSHLESKLKLMLLIWYHRNKDLKRLEYSIAFVSLYDLYSELLKKDLAIIIDDYNIIVNKIISGNAHKLSESDTKYLGACTKGSSAIRSLQPQYYSREIFAKRRAFCLKQSYMSYILNNYVNKSLINYDSIFNENELISGNFEEQILNKIKKYIGKTENNLYNLFSVDTKIKAKQINKILINKILGVQTKNSEEFEKANIVIKKIRVRKNGYPKESMSFPKIVIKNFITQDFETSLEYQFFEMTRFLLVIFKENDCGEFILKGAKFWNMPIDELETIGKKDWESYKNKFINGINFNIKIQKNNKLIIGNDLPKKSETYIFHLRPHAKKSSYLINGIKYGEGTFSDMDTLPNGNKMTHQCFWINNNYIVKIIEDLVF